jgi:hypothetical protein
MVLISVKRLSRPQTIVRLEGVVQLKKIHDLIGNLTSDLKGNPKYCKKNFANVTLSTKIPTWKRILTAIVGGTFLTACDMSRSAATNQGFMHVGETATWKQVCVLLTYSSFHYH